MKFSKQREMILNTIIESDLHLTADSIYNKLKSENPGLSLGTVYRNLSLLSEKGFIKKVSIPSQPDKFDKNINPHGHIICSCCNNIYDVSYESLNLLINNISSNEGISINSYDVILNGLCKECNKK